MTLWAAAEALREAIGAPLPPVCRPDHDASVAGLRTGLGDQRFRSLWRKGRAAAVDDVIALAS